MKLLKEMTPFPSITIEHTRYPTVILGGDRFMGIFGKPRHAHLEQIITTPAYISTIFEACYQYGFRGYDISMGEHIIACFARLKEKYPECIGIGNPNWDCGIMLGKKNLRDEVPRINAFLFNHVFSDNEKSAIANLCESQRQFWFVFPPNTPSLTSHERASIYLDVEKYQANLDRIKDLCDFCLIGTVFADWLPLLGREDILQDMIALVRDNGLIPLSIHHWTSLVLPLLDSLNVAGHWTYINNTWQLLNAPDAIRAIRQSAKPTTAFKVLLSREQEAIEASFDYVFRDVKVNAVDFGIETCEEAQLISKILHEKYIIDIERNAKKILTGSESDS